MALLAPNIVKCGKIFLLALNVLGLILSIGIVAVSAVLYRAGDVASDNNIMALLNQLAINYEISVGYLMRNISIGLLVVGIVILLTSVFGFLGAFYKKIPFMIVYVALVFKICGFEIFVLYMFFKLKDELFHTLKIKMLALLKVYQGDTLEPITMAWNHLFLWLDCCGVNSQLVVDDFADTEWSIRDRRYKEIPGYCCVGASTITASSYFGKDCTLYLQPTTSSYQKGCYTKITDYMQSFCNGFISTSFILLFIEGLAIGSALLIVFHVRGKRQKFKAVLQEKLKQQMTQPPQEQQQQQAIPQVPEIKPLKICWRCGIPQEFLTRDRCCHNLDPYVWRLPSNQMYYPPGTYKSDALGRSEFRHSFPAITYDGRPAITYGGRRGLQEPEVPEIILTDPALFDQEFGLPIPIANRFDRSLRPELQVNPLYYGMPPWTMYNPYDFRLRANIGYEKDRKK